MVEQVSVSVVIPTYNAAQTIERCVEGLRKQSLMPLEIIIVDNGSSDATVDYITSVINDFPCKIRLLNEASRGAAAARNCGVRAASGAWIAFTDSDCIPDKQWLSSGCDLIKEKNCLAMAGPAWGTMEGDLSAKLLGLTTLSVGCEDHWREDAGETGINGFASANFWINKSLFDQVEGFDESLTVSGEDYDLCARVFETGTAVYYSTSLKVRHIHPLGIKTLAAKAVSYGNAHGILFERYGQPGAYFDFVGGFRKKFPFRKKLWINLVSADKKMMVLLMLGIVWPLFLLLALFYPFVPARFLQRRAKELGECLSLMDAYFMGWLLILRSLAFTVGRIQGSSLHVWVL
ncbi:MAG: glycosyltransferase family 2 protein [Mariprofundaceae bacterium]